MTSLQHASLPFPSRAKYLARQCFPELCSALALAEMLSGAVQAAPGLAHLRLIPLCLLGMLAQRVALPEVLSEG